MRLEGRQYQQLMDALTKAFPTPARLEQMLRVRLDRSLYEITVGENLPHMAFEIIQAAEAEGWLDQLVLGAREAAPGNGLLVGFAQRWGMVPADTPDGPELEVLIRKTNAFLDINTWRAKLGEVEAQVCRVEVGNGAAYGTGFLLGPDVVMTNYHVVAGVIERGAAKPSDIVFRFDYKQLPDGKTVNEGTVYRAAADWLIDHSPMSPFDTISNPPEEPDPTHLDYALLRVDGAPGRDTVGRTVEPDGQTRKWVGIPAQFPDLVPQTPLFIVQHPQTKPLKLALDTEAVIGVNANGTRVRYRTNTEGGSSGSPCFSQNWELVALHHLGDPNFGSPRNQGIPFSAIRQLLRERQLNHVLSDQ
jgi:hypothetical protein